MSKFNRGPDPDVLAQRLSKLAGKGRVRDLLPLVPKIAGEYPHHAGIQQALSEVLIAAKERPQALAHARKAVDLDPNNARHRVHLALCQIADGNLADARAILVQTEPLVSPSADGYAMLASLFVRVNDHHRAVTWYQKAIELDPKNARHHFSLAATWRFLGQLEQAERACDRALALDPTEYEVYLIRSDLRTQTAEDNHIPQMEQQLAAGVPHYMGESMLCHALAKECEDVGEFEKSFDYLSRGAKVRREHLDYVVEKEVSLIEEIIRCFTPEALQSASAGSTSDAPIFVIGMPRTGTTLVERILGEHPRVTSAGELPNFPQIMASQARLAAQQEDVSQVDLVAASLKIDMAALGKHYIESVARQVAFTGHFIDKLPFNFLNVGLIHLALPGARIIHVTRNPMDTCYAVYKTLFQRAYPFSYDLSDLGRYFVAYFKLMAHWNSLFPGTMLELRYEDLVADQEGQSRRMLEHCGLEWDARVTEFHRSREASTTASASQVRQPVYASSVGKWLNYERQLAPLEEILRAAGIRGIRTRA